MQIDKRSSYRVGFPRIRALPLVTLPVSWDELKHEYKAIREILRRNKVVVHDLSRAKRLRATDTVD